MPHTTETYNADDDANQTNTENSIPASVQVFNNAVLDETNNEESFACAQAENNLIILCDGSSTTDQIILLQSCEDDSESASMVETSENNATERSSDSSYSEYKLCIVPTQQLQYFRSDGVPFMYEMVDVPSGSFILQNSFSNGLEKAEAREEISNIKFSSESHGRCVEAIGNIEFNNEAPGHEPCPYAISNVEFSSGATSHECTEAINKVEVSNEAPRQRYMEAICDNEFNNGAPRYKESMIVISNVFNNETPGHEQYIEAIGNVEFNKEGPGHEHCTETTSNVIFINDESRLDSAGTIANPEFNNRVQGCKNKNIENADFNHVASTWNSVPVNANLKAKSFPDDFDREPSTTWKRSVSDHFKTNTSNDIVYDTQIIVQQPSQFVSTEQVTEGLCDISTRKVSNKTATFLIYHQPLPRKIHIVRSELPLSKAENKKEFTGFFLFQQVISPKDFVHKCLLCPEQSSRYSDLGKHYRLDHCCTVKLSCARFNKNIVFIVVPKQVQDLQLLSTLNKACLYCNINLPTALAAHDHYQSRHSKNVCLIPEPAIINIRSFFYCGMCPSVATDFSSHLNHIKLEHLNQTYHCATCNFKSRDMQTLQSHIKTHLQEQSDLEDIFLTCPVCSVFFLDAESLLVHIKSEHPTEVKEVAGSMSCANCSSRCKDNKEILTHIENYLVLYEGSRNKAFQKHITAILKEKTCRCPHCLTFMEDRNANRCAECSQIIYRPSRKPKMYRRQISLEAAKWIKKTCIEHKCSDCLASFSSEERLRQHLFKMNHSSCISSEKDVILLKCITCSHFFLSKNNFKSHRCRQLGRWETIRYKCCFCDKKFIYIHFYEKHLLHIHMVWVKPETKVPMDNNNSTLDGGQCMSQHLKQSSLWSTNKGSELLMTSSEFSEVSDSAAEFSNVLDLSIKTCNMSDSTAEFLSESDQPVESVRELNQVDSCSESSFAEFLSDEQNKNGKDGIICDIKSLVTFQDLPVPRNFGRLGFPAKYTNFCHLCNKTICKYAHFYIHMQEYHKLEKKFQCVVTSCSFRTSNLKEFQRHSDFHVQSTIYNCYVCDIIFGSDNELEEHLRTNEHGDRYISMHEQGRSAIEPQNYKCTKCYSWFGLRSSFIMHRETCLHKYDCPKCDLRFLLPEKRRAHIEQDHPESSKVCEFCSEEFVAAEDLWNHLKMHNTLLECETCHIYFWKEERFLLHMETHESVLHCHWAGCTEKFSVKLELYKHFNNHRDGFQCTCCEKRFCAQSVLEEHLRKLHGIVSAKTGKESKKKEKQDVEGEQSNQLSQEGEHGLLNDSKQGSPAQDKNTIPCTRCEKTFRFGRSCRQHLRRTHGIIPMKKGAKSKKQENHNAVPKDERKQISKEKEPSQILQEEEPNQILKKGPDQSLERGEQNQILKEGEQNQILKEGKQNLTLKDEELNHILEGESNQTQKDGESSETLVEEIYRSDNNEENFAQSEDFIPCICCEETFCSEEKYRDHIRNHQVKKPNYKEKLLESIQKGQETPKLAATEIYHPLLYVGSDVPAITETPSLDCEGTLVKDSRNEDMGETDSVLADRCMHQDRHKKNLYCTTCDQLLSNQEIFSTSEILHALVKPDILKSSRFMFRPIVPKPHIIEATASESKDEQSITDASCKQANTVTKEIVIKSVLRGKEPGVHVHRKPSKITVQLKKSQERTSAAQAAVENILKKYQPILICKEGGKATVKKAQQSKKANQSSDQSTKLVLRGEKHGSLLPCIKSAMNATNNSQTECMGFTGKKPGSIPPSPECPIHSATENTQPKEVDLTVKQFEDDVSNKRTSGPTVLIGQELESLQPCLESKVQVTMKNLTPESLNGVQLSALSLRPRPVIINVSKPENIDSEGQKNATGISDTHSVASSSIIASEKTEFEGCENQRDLPIYIIQPAVDVSMETSMQTDLQGVLPIPSDPKSFVLLKKLEPFLNYKRKRIRRVVPILPADEDNKRKVYFNRQPARHSWICCGKTFDSKRDFTEHIDCHERDLFCVYCDKQFSVDEEFRQHIKSHEQESAESQEAVSTIENEIFEAIRKSEKPLLCGKIEPKSLKPSGQDTDEISAHEKSTSKDEQELVFHEVPSDIGLHVSNVPTSDFHPQKNSTSIPCENLAVTVVHSANKITNSAEKEVLEKHRYAKTAFKSFKNAQTEARHSVPRGRTNENQSDHETQCETNDPSPRKRKRIRANQGQYETNNEANCSSAKRQQKCKNTKGIEDCEKIAKTDCEPWHRPKKQRRKLKLKQVFPPAETDEVDLFSVPVKKKIFDTNSDGKSMFSHGLKIHSIFSLAANPEPIFPPRKSELPSSSLITEENAVSFSSTAPVLPKKCSPSLTQSKYCDNSSELVYDNEGNLEAFVISQVPEVGFYLEL